MVQAAALFLMGLQSAHHTRKTLINWPHSAVFANGRELHLLLWVSFASKEVRVEGVGRTIGIRATDKSLQAALVLHYCAALHMST